MERFSRVVCCGLLVGSLWWNLRTAFADPGSTAMPYGGYFDHFGVFHRGVSPPADGWFDARGGWHPGVPPYRDQDPETYRPTHFNYYAGYGSRYDLDRGYTYVIGPSGLRTQVDLQVERTLVRLTNDDTLEPRLDIARGFDRGLVGAPNSSFDPMRLSIPTGRHLTFYTDNGPHTLYAVQGASLQQPVTITPGEVFSWTFTRPGNYRLGDSFGSGPRRHALIVEVYGEPTVWDDAVYTDTRPAKPSP